MALRQTPGRWINLRPARQMLARKAREMLVRDLEQEQQANARIRTQRWDDDIGDELLRLIFNRLPSKAVARGPCGAGAQDDLWSHDGRGIARAAFLLPGKRTIAQRIVAGEAGRFSEIRPDL